MDQKFLSAMPPRQFSQQGEYQESKALAEIKGKMFLARQFPRDITWALNSALAECGRPELAQAAQYEYKRGDTVVKGPSIRLVEVLARNWGNIDFGVNEIEFDGESTTVKAYCWDLETNVSDEKIFTVKHERGTKKGSYKLTDSRDIYELVANNGARRKRACILSVLPGWYVDAAIEECEKTLRANLTKGRTLEEVRASMIQAFEAYSVTPAMLESKVNKPIDAFNENDIVKLGKLHSAIKDGFVKVKDAFEIDNETSAPQITNGEQETLESLNKALNEARTKAKEGKSGGTDKR